MIPTGRFSVTSIQRTRNSSILCQSHWKLSQLPFDSLSRSKSKLHVPNTRPLSTGINDTHDNTADSDALFNIPSTDNLYHLDHEGEDILSRALREEREEQIKEQQLYESARALRNEKVLETRHGKVIETVFNESPFEIPSIWITVREFQNWYNVLKVHKFKDPPYGVMMKHILNHWLQLHFIEDIKAQTPIKHSICINDVIVLDFKDIIAKHGGRCAVELTFNQKAMGSLTDSNNNSHWMEIKYILQDLGHYFQRALLIPPESALSHKICRDIMVDYQKRFVTEHENIGTADLLFQLKRKGVLIPDAVIQNLTLSLPPPSTKGSSSSPSPETVRRPIYDGVRSNLFEEHPVAWLLNHYYFMMYLGYKKDGTLSFAANYNRHQLDDVDPKDVARKIAELIHDKASQGLSLQYFIGSYRRKYGEFPRGGGNYKCTLSDYIQESGVFLAYYPQEVSALRMFQNRVGFHDKIECFVFFCFSEVDMFMYFENLKLGISNHCANENYDGYLSTRKIYEIFGVPSMTFLTNFFSDFEFVPQWSSRNGARTVYIKNLSEKRALRMANKSKMIYSSEFEVLFNQILSKNGGYVFLSDLNRLFIKYFDASMDPNIVIHKLLAKYPNIHYLPWNYSFSPLISSSNKGMTSSTLEDQQGMNWCDQIVFDVNDPKLDSIVQIPILIKIFRHDLNHCKRLLSHNSSSSSSSSNEFQSKQSNRIWSQSTNYRDHLVQREAFETHLKHHGKLKDMEFASDWSLFLEEVESDGVSFLALDHEAILDSLRTTFMGETSKLSVNKKSIGIGVDPKSVSPKTIAINSKQSKIDGFDPIKSMETKTMESMKAMNSSSSSSLTVMPSKEVISNSMNTPSTSMESNLSVQSQQSQNSEILSEGIYQRLDHMVSTFETKLDKVLSELQQRQLSHSPSSSVDSSHFPISTNQDLMDGMIDDNAHLQLIGSSNRSTSSFINSQKSVTSKQSLSVFGEETLKSMLLDCCKSGFSKPAINIATYMAQNNMLCNTEHYIGLMRIQYDSLSTEIWKEMMQRHSITDDPFTITVQTFQSLRLALSDQWFKALLLNNVQKLSNDYDMSPVERQQNEEIMTILLKYVQEYSQENLAEWFSRYVNLDKRPLNTVFWKKAALMLAVVFSKNASKVHYTPKSYNEALQRCLDPWCHDIDSIGNSLGSYGRKMRGKSKSLLSDDDQMEFVAQQLEQLIMRVSNSAELMDTLSLQKLLKLYSTTLTSTASPSSSHIVRDKLQYIALSVLQKQKGPIPEEVMSLLEASKLNTELFQKIDVMNAADDGNSEYIEEKLFQQQNHQHPPSGGPSTPWMKKELLASFANKGDVETLLSSMDSLEKLLTNNRDDGLSIGGSFGSDPRRAEALRSHHIYLREAVSKFLNQCTDINVAFLMMDKLLRSPAGQRVVTFGYFQRMIEIGIRAPSATSHWFQIKNLLQLLLALPYRAILQIDIFNVMLNYCLVHQDIVGLTDVLQMMFDWMEETHCTSKLSADFVEQIMEFIATKSSDAALHLFQKLSPHSEQPTFRCLYWVLKSSADQGDQVGMDTVRDLMTTNGITQKEWDVEVYNAIIRCNSFRGEVQMDDSLHLLDDLLSNGLRPNIETFNGLLSHHHRSGDGDDGGKIDVGFMVRLMERMEEFQIKPSQETFSIILEFCAQHKEREIASKVFAMIHELPKEQKEKVIGDASVWLHYVQCFDDYREMVTQIKRLLQQYGGISRQLLTNEMFDHLCTVTFSRGADDREVGAEEVVFANTVIRMRNIENVIESIVDEYRESDEGVEALSLDMSGYSKVFEGMYSMEKDGIHSLNLETGIYNLRQIESVFWRLMDKMKDLNIFYPDPDLLRPYLFLKDLEMECYSKSQSVDDMTSKYENIVDGVFRFIEYGVFVSPELIEDLCDSIGSDKERTRCILNVFHDKRHQQQQLRLKQPLPKLSF